MLSLGIAYSAIYLGPWGDLKDAANIAWHRDWSRFLHHAGRFRDSPRLRCQRASCWLARGRGTEPVAG